MGVGAFISQQVLQPTEPFPCPVPHSYLTFLPMLTVGSYEMYIFPQRHYLNVYESKVS